MTVTNVHEIAQDLYRISTPVPMESIPGGFTFNQFLLVDDEPLLFHTGPRRLFASTRDAVRQVMAPSKLRWIAFSHVEADECGALNEWLAEAPGANPLCSQTAAMVSIGDLADREPRGLADGERIATGRNTLTWLDAPNLPHGWECGYLFEARTRTLLCGDLLTQPGAQVPAVTESDAAIWEPSEGMRKAMSYFADLRNPASVIEKLAATEPEVLACMHGSSYRGKGAPLLRRLGEALSAD
jgi:flavorubredoxin